MEETSIRYQGDFNEPIAAAMLASFTSALALDSKVPDWILQLHGMSGRLYRRFINNLVGNIPSARYLEIGSWAGSTACSAIYGNDIDIVCIDNWSEFGGPKQVFENNISLAKSDITNFKFIENDFRNVDYEKLGKFNIYLYDGPHSYEDQYDGIKIAQPALDDLYVQIVDDWNWPYVRAGTLDAISDINADILCSIEIRTTQDDSHPVKSQQQDSAWHNGYFISLISKR
ncbi:class I SAM-dependent methyltransferase [Sphingomonas sp. Root710]|uniref:class I SAM-dependent methyltransferase n=1 Tax=Sphingomonas sp. Root710 TaxID=1736594 RepID=UPI000A839127|nr:class I SAM-dependent methyltransferase [Sphingomonas sp. Root710]